MSLVRGEPSVGAGVGSRPTIIVTVNAETLHADIAGTGPGNGPVNLSDVAELAVRADMYTAIRATSGAVLNFGRSRRLATLLQRLAVIVRDGGRCAITGCDAGHERCEVHHMIEYEHGGVTDLNNLALLCPAHHTHLHINELHLQRQNGNWTTTSNHTTHPTDPQQTEWADTG